MHSVWESVKSVLCCDKNGTSQSNATSALLYLPDFILSAIDKSSEIHVGVKTNCSHDYGLTFRKHNKRVILIICLDSSLLDIVHIHII